MRLTVLAIVVLLVTPAFADENADLLSRFRAEARVFTDGKGHYLATLIEDQGEPLMVLYGDASTLTGLPPSGFARDRDTKAISFDYSDPRSQSAAGVDHVVLSGGGAKVTCAKRVAMFSSVPDPDARKLLAKATLSAEGRWNREPYVLARDEGTTYFFVDRTAQPRNGKEFHVYTGKRGRLKPLKVNDLVSDTAGSVFVTSQGTLRFTLGGESGARTIVSGTWTPARKPAKTPLVLVPLTEELVYTDLAIYMDQRMGTPCDDI